MNTSVGDVFKAAINGNTDEIRSIVRKRIDRPEKSGEDSITVLV